MIEHLTFKTQIYLFAVTIEKNRLKAAMGLFDRGLVEGVVTVRDKNNSFRVQIPKSLLRLNIRTKIFNVEMKICD